MEIAQIIIKFKPALETSFEKRIFIAQKLRELISEQSIRREGIEIIFVERAGNE